MVEKTLSRIVRMVLVSVFPLSISLLILFYGITVPIMDQWTFAPLLYKAHTGSFELQDLWSQHTESFYAHRHFFPKLILFILAYISKWNMYYGLYTTFAFVLLNLLMLTTILKWSLGTSYSHWYAVLLSALVFSPSQYETFLVSWNLNKVLANLVMLVAIYSAVRFSGIKTLAITLSAATVAFYSFSSFIILWPIIGVILLINPRWHIRYFFIMCSVFLVVTAFYFLDYSYDNPELTFLWDEPIKSLTYVLAYLGSSVFRGAYYVSCILGFCFLLVFACLLVYLGRLGKDAFMKAIPWIAIGSFEIANAFTVASGRLYFSVEQAMASRYTTMSVFFIISTIMLLICAIKNMPTYSAYNKKRIYSFLLPGVLLFALLYAQTYKTMLTSVPGWSSSLNEAAACLENIETADDACLEKLSTNPSYVRDNVRLLREIGFR